MRILFFVVALLCSYSSLLCAQENSRDTLYLTFTKVPIPAVDTTVSAMYLLAHPLRPPQTPGDRYRVDDWVRLDYSKHQGILVPSPPKSGIYKWEKQESRFIYVQNPKKEQKYVFYYKGEEGELISDEEFKESNCPKFSIVRELLQPYNHVVLHKRKDPYEVYRWQHPNLYVVVYDKTRKGYYRYRIALTIYRDPYHPEASVMEE